MKYRIAENNRYSKYLIKWKHNQRIKSVDYGELKKEIDEDAIIQEKIDGELAIFEWKKGEDPVFGSLGFAIRKDLPVLDEIVKILEAKGYNQATIFGDLAYSEKKGLPSHFNITMSKIRSPKSKEDEDKIHFYIFELDKLNGEKKSRSYKEYLESFDLLYKLFGSSKRTFPVEYFKGGKNLTKAWDKFVEKEKNEGIVVREKGIIVKCKPGFTLDLAVIAFQEGKGKNKGKLGAFLTALYDGTDFILRAQKTPSFRKGMNAHPKNKNIQNKE